VQLAPVPTDQVVEVLCVPRCVLNARRA